MVPSKTFEKYFELARFIFEETHLPQLLAKSLEVLMQHSGANEGCFLLPSLQESPIYGMYTWEVNVAQGIVNEDKLPWLLIDYVTKSQSALILKNAKKDIQHHPSLLGQSIAVQSVLCLPILCQGKMVAVLYLANSQYSGTFTQEHIDLVNLLSAQLAISIVNAQLSAQHHTVLTQKPEISPVPPVPSMAHSVKPPPEGTILMIEDPAEDLQIIHRWLKRHHYHVLTTNKEHQVASLIKTHQPDLVVVELIVPRLSRYQLCQQLRTIHPLETLPIVILTSSERAEDVKEILACDVNDYLTAPFTNEQLLDCLENQIQLKRSTERSTQEIPRLLASLMNNTIRYWEESTGKTKIELAEDCGLWKVYNDKGTYRTRTMDKYLNLKTIPKNPRWRDVLKTVDYALTHSPSKESMQSLKKNIEQKVHRFAEITDY